MAPRIDFHTHVVPATLSTPRGPDDSRPVLVAGDTHGEVYIRGQHFRTIVRECWDLAARAEAMATRGVTRHVLSPMPELFSYWAPVDAAVRLCREINEWLAAGVAAGRGAFTALGTVPLQEPDTATAMLADIAGLGLAGVEIGTHVNGVPLHAARFEGFFSEAERLGLTVFVHAFHPHERDWFETPAAANGVLFPIEIGRALGGLIMGGTLSRHPALKLVASHGGGALAAFLPRLDFIWSATDALADVIERPPSEVARSLHVDSLVYDNALLELLAARLGDTAVVYGTDYPFFPAPPDPPDHLVAALDRAAEQLLSGQPRPTTSPLRP